VALEVESSGWTTEDRARTAGSYPSNVPGKSTLGCTTHPRRTHDARLLSRSVDSVEVYGEAARATFARLADVPAQPCDGIVSVDLLTAPTIGFKRLYAFVIVRHLRREIVRIAVTKHPTAEWLARQITEAFPWDTAPAILVRDNDRVFGDIFQRRVKAMGIRDQPISPRSPWQNGYVERVIGSIRRECLNHVIVFGEAHLQRVLDAYADYYNSARTHLSLDKNAPRYRAIECHGSIYSRPVLAGACIITMLGSNKWKGHVANVIDRLGIKRAA
jgi:transposase InsO family protein